MNIISALNKQSDAGVLLLRLFVGVRLIYGVTDNIFSWQHMLQFRDFLQAFHFPFPLVCAVISVYAQLLAGIMIILGWKIRLAAFLMIINFSIAVLVHRNDTFEQMTPALALLFCCVLFLFQGGGRYSLRI